MSDDFGLWDVLVSMFWFMLLFAWIFLFIRIIGDIFRDRELSGGAKALWTLLLIFLPWLGALLYLIVRGKSMNQRSVLAAEGRAANYRAWAQDAAGNTSSADELRILIALRDRGALNQVDYERAKAKFLA